MSWSENHWLVDALPVFKRTLSVIQLHSEFQKCSPNLGSSHLCIWWPSTSISKPAEWRRGSRGDCVSLKEALATPAHILPARTESCDQNSLQAWLWHVFLYWILLLIKRVSDCWTQLVTMRSPYRLWNESVDKESHLSFIPKGVVIIIVSQNLIFVWKIDWWELRGC